MKEIIVFLFSQAVSFTLAGIGVSKCFWFKARKYTSGNDKAAL